MADEMTRGFEVAKHAPGSGTTLPPIPFFKGCVISPFKKLESELMTQLFKLHKKSLAALSAGCVETACFLKLLFCVSSRSAPSICLTVPAEEALMAGAKFIPELSAVSMFELTNG